jgi:hypothetical protein
MMSEAEAEMDGLPGLRFIAQAREEIRRSANPYDKMYNSRTGLALAYGYDPRNLEALAQQHGLERPAIHESVIRRIRSGTEGYAPLGLPCNFEIAVTRGTHADIGELENTRRHICEALGAAASAQNASGRPPLASGLQAWVNVRRSTNWVVFWALIGIVLAPWIAGLRFSGAEFFSSLWTLPAWDAASRIWHELIVWVAGLALLVWQATALAKRRMRRATNKFWRNVFRKV